MTPLMTSIQPPTLSCMPDVTPGPGAVSSGRREGRGRLDARPARVAGCTAPESTHRLSEVFMKRALPVLLVVTLTGACVQVFPPGPPGPANARAPDAPAAQAQGEEKEKDPFKPWDDVLEDTRAIDGYFRFHLKRDNTLLLELKLEQLGMDFGMALHQGPSVAYFGMNAGLAIDYEMRLMRFRRVGDQVQLLHLIPRFAAAVGTP